MSSTTSKRDYYELLEVERTASADAIRKAFRRLAREHHPDVNQGDRASEERFKDIKEAYEVLSDPDRRRQYDQFGHADPRGGMGFDADRFGADIFDMFFGGGRQAPRHNAPQVGSDLRYDLEITLEDAAHGCEKSFVYEREQTCSECAGAGTRGGTTPANCTMCGGAGQVRRTQQSFFGSIATVGACPQCQGRGTVITDPCPKCRGAGRERVETERVLQVPVGVDTGNRIQVRGAGDGGVRGGPPGDLYVFIHIADHDRFERRGNDLFTEVTVPFAQAALGATVPVTTLDGSTELKVPAGTQPGHVFTLRGEGMPGLHNRGRGDLHAVVTVPVPRKLNDKQRRAIEEMAIALGDSASGGRGESHGLRGLIEKAKEALDLD